MGKNICKAITSRKRKCESYEYTVCEDCGKSLCFQHVDRDKHKCDDSVKGCHSIWRRIKR